MTEKFFVVKVRDDGWIGAVCGPYDYKVDAERAINLGNERAHAVDPYTWFSTTSLVGTSDLNAYAHLSSQVVKVKTWLASKARRES